MCDAFEMPLMMLDVPGYLIVVAPEARAFAQATVPRVRLVTCRAFGGAFITMSPRALGPTRVFAWPTAEVNELGTRAAVRSCTAALADRQPVCRQ